MPNGVQQYTTLEHRLTLLAWLNSLFGYASNKAMLEDCKEVDEGYAADGYSHLYHHLLARGSKVQIPETDLASYDHNVYLHLERINRHRSDHITLRYFQHLAALYTEIFLDGLFNHQARLLAELNAFVAKRNAQKPHGEPPDAQFTEANLTKLAYWMATGSGKTLILHLNYYQFMHYNREPLDNILLITPNEELSEQHLRELALSGIPARRFDLNRGNLLRQPNEVQVLEITKLVNQKQGSGVRVPVEAFEGRNLLFVDEGHKGAGGETWRSYRDALGASGFTFEYSATFGQALSAAGDDELTKEYGQAIVFDYSYRYFYGDGFGKDFRILNIHDEERPGQVETLLLGNLLSFYEQLRLYHEHEAELRAYQLEQPLWVFVGSKVNAVYSENRRKRSDVLTVVRFLHHLLRDRRWATDAIGKLLRAQSGLRGPDGDDVFADLFKYLQESHETAGDVYQDILQRVFHTSAGGGLHLTHIRDSDGEIGLKATGADRYFGLIYIGDTSAFKKLVEEQAPEITVEEDAIGGPVFPGINRPNSEIHMLIGAKKFLEGWNSWRVSNMGLLNIGRKEGAQIIQLFGRGVRLKGSNMSLKRSTALPGEHPRYVTILETLNIFAVRANYMTQFRDYLEREGVETEPVIERTIKTKIDEQALRKSLLIPRAQQGRDFIREMPLVLEADDQVRIQVDFSFKVQTMQSTTRGLRVVAAHSGAQQRITDDSLALVDWEKIYLDMIDYKMRQGWHNLVVRPDAPRQLIHQIAYMLIADDAIVQPNTFSERQLLQQAVTSILLKYMDAFYRRRRERWERDAMVYRTLDTEDPNLAFNRELVGGREAAYLVRVKRSDTELLKSIEELLRNTERLYCREDQDLPRIHFDRHLYLPLLVKETKLDEVKTVPPPLTESEARFLRDLKAFWTTEQERSLAGKEIYVLRNLSRGKGVGFFENYGFYPDFILWVLDRLMADAESQRIIFVEPHGMLHAKAYIHDEKARLHERLPALAKELATRSGQNNVSLDAWIISATPYDELCRYYDDGTWDRGKFSEKHILFPELGPAYNYVKIILMGRESDRWVPTGD